MELISQKPNIQDKAAFIRAMAEALEQMHAQQHAHGGIASGSIEGWITPAGDALDAEKFKATARPAEELAVDPLRHDVGVFAAYCVTLITGGAAVPGRPFLAAYYQGAGLSLAFLQLLEKLNANPDAEVTMGEMCEALNAPDPLPEPVMVPAPPPEPTPEPESVAAEPPPEPVPIPASAPAPAPEPRVPKRPSPILQPVITISLRNATVGKPFEVEPGVIAAAVAQKRGENPQRAKIVSIQLPEDCGLVFDAATGGITGTPTRPFEGSFTLDYLATPESASLPIKVTFLINPDPASLWKDLPPPADAPYQKDLLDHSEVQLGAFRIVAASRRGRSHANKGEFRDDDYAVGYAAETGWLVVVVADGAGSATYSRRGSQIACAVAKTRLVDALNSAQYNQAEALYSQHRDWQHAEVQKALRQSLYEAALLAHHKLREEVGKPSETLAAAPTLRNYDTTLILLVMKKVGEGCVAATFSIGDGGAGILPHAGEGHPLTLADSGEHAGQTIFLTFDSTVSANEANLQKRFHLLETKDFAGALAMTDGITDPKFPSDAAFADPAQWATLWAELQPALGSSQELLDWMNFFSPGNHDDRTLVAVLPAATAATS